MTNFTGQVAVVTGGASGIGKAIATALKERGAKVAIADISREAAAGVAEALGDGARGYRCDVSDRADVEALAASVLRDFGRVNLLFVNAGVAVGGTILETDPREFDWMFDVNVRGAFHTIQVFAPAVQQAASNGEEARIVLTGSENSVCLPTWSVGSGYTATKHATLALADGLRRDLEGTGVSVSIFCPGLVNTNIWDGRRNRQDRYGGSSAVPNEEAAQITANMSAAGQDPELTVQLLFEGLERGDFMMIMDPNVRQYTEKRHGEVDAALDLLDQRLAAGA